MIVQLERVDYTDNTSFFTGQTAEKTRKKIEEAEGATMLVDEAYQLTCVASENDFGSEAFDTIMESIEGGTVTTTNRPAYIFAGYPDQMTLFVKCNQGMARRITKTFEFEDYSYKELAEILLIMAKQQQFTISVALEEMRELFARNFSPELTSRHNAGLCTHLLKHARSAANKRLMVLLRQGTPLNAIQPMMQRIELEDMQIAFRAVVKELS